MIIDAHTHIDRANEIDWKPEQLIANMDEAGIDYSLVISNDITDAPLDKVLEVTKPYARFKVIGNVTLANFNEAQIDTLIEHLKNKNIVGVKLYPGYENYYPTDEKFTKLFEFCQENNHPIVIHTGVLMTGCSGLLKQAHPLNVDELAAKYPKLKIVIAHFGNPWLIDTVAVMWRHPNVYTDLSGFFVEFRPIDPREASDFLDRMKNIKSLLGSFRRCIFGTDWPLYNQKEYLGTVQKIELTEEEKDRVFSKNAINVYNLDWK